MVDNGILSFEGVCAAKAAGMNVLVIDYYLFGKMLLEVDVIVNFNQLGCDFVSKNLVGVGVVFYLLVVFCSCLKVLGWFE